jgi:hypothetical protein
MLGDGAGRTMSRKRFVRIILSRLAALSFLVITFELVFPQPPRNIRPCSLRNRIECKLEKLGFIQRDAFRHIEG